MSGKRLTILTILVAVLSMHGVQYMTGGPHRSAAVTAEHPVDAPASTALPLVAVALAADVGTATASQLAVAASAVMTGTGPGHGIPAHVGALCLAVLLVGLALLGAALVRRTRAVPVDGPASGPLDPTRRSRPPRPPDLSVLCLLRI